MHCPFCPAIDTKVADSRLIDEGTRVRRRRVCPECDNRFNTYESVDLRLPRVIKHDDSRQNYDQDKIHKGILHSLEKRPVDTKAVDVVLVNLKKRMLQSGEKEISSRQVGEWVLDELKRLDEVAYVRFASVYRSFQDVGDFVTMIKNLEVETNDRLQQNQLLLLAKDK